MRSKPRVFLVSTAHPATDPRIGVKQCRTLAHHYEVYCALPRADPTVCPEARFIRLPYFRRVVWRVLLTGPLVLWQGLRLRPDVIQIYVPELIPVALLLRLLGTPIIYEVQENLYQKLHIRTLNRGRVLEWAFRRFDRLARRYCYLIFTEHSYLATYTNLTKPHTVVYNYPLLASTEPFRRPYRPNPAEPSFIIIGLLSVERAIDTLIDAIQRVKLTHPGVQLHLYGRRTFTDAELTRMPGFAGVRDNLQFYGYTDQRIAFGNPAHHTAGLALLKPVGDYPGSYPTKLFEYMALGLPVVTSDFPLYRNVVETHACGLCVSATDPGAVADALLYLIEHPAEARAMAERGHRAVRSVYAWDTEAKKLLNFYQLVGASRWN